MNFLYATDNGSRLRIDYDQCDAEQLKFLPTCRYSPGKRSMILLPQIEVWKALREWDMDIEHEAQAILDKLQKAHKTNRRQIRSAQVRYKGESVTEIPVPLKTIPFTHQVRGYGFSHILDQSAYLMEQGTGKTLCALALCAYRFLQGQVRRVLIVCPKSVIPVWPREMAKHLNIDYQVRIIDIKNLYYLDSCPVLSFFIINYDKLRNRYKQILKFNPDMIMLDESHSIKPSTSKRSKVCYLLGDKVQYRNILTGTPLGQKLIDAWGQYRFLNPNVFGRSFADFKARYCRMGGYMGKEIIGYKNIDEFTEKMHSIAFRVTKKECLDLPPESSQNYYVTPSRHTKRIYQELKLDFATQIEGETLEVDIVLAQMMKLRQIVGGLVKHEDKILPVSQEKVSVLEEIMQDKNWDKKLIVAVSFLHEIKLVKKLCKKLGLGYIILSGSTPQSKRMTIEERFRENGRKKVLILQVDTGGEGLDFTAADMIAFYSPSFSFIKTSQIKARIHRIGQDRPVTYIYIIMEGTIDEQIVEFLNEYGDITQLILETNRDYKLKPGEIMDAAELNSGLKLISQEIKKPKRIPRRKSMPKKIATPQKKVAYEYSLADMAEGMNLEPAKLRLSLKKAGIEKPEQGWKWAKKSHAAPVARELRIFLKKEKLAKREKVQAKKAAEKAKALADRERKAAKRIRDAIKKDKQKAKTQAT